MKTRDKILNKALEMFNTHGISEVSLRDIAKKIDISVGNLNYHFPTTNDIIYELSVLLVDDVNKAITAMMKVSAPNPLVSMHDMMRVIFTTHLKYKFLFKGRYAEIVTAIPIMQDRIQESFANHFIHGIHIFQQLVKEGFLKKDILPDLNGFIYSQNMLVIYWQQEFTIFQPKLSDKKKVEQVLSLAFHPYRPYLTAKGKSTLTPLLKKLKPYKKGGNR